MKRSKKYMLLSMGGIVLVLGLITGYIAYNRTDKSVNQARMRIEKKKDDRNDSIKGHRFSGLGYFDLMADSNHPLILEMGKEWRVAACKPAIFVAQRGEDSLNRISVLHGSVLLIIIGSGIKVIKVDAGFEVYHSANDTSHVAAGLKAH